MVNIQIRGPLAHITANRLAENEITSMIRSKKNISENIYKNYGEKIFDNIFQNIEYHIRELGHGDVSVNKNMKNLSKIFYDILYNIDQDNIEAELGKNLLKKYFFIKSNNENEKIVNLLEYFKKFRNFCFDLDINIMLNGSIDFNYR